jgi:AcrR family transcriptional regulator
MFTAARPSLLAGEKVPFEPRQPRSAGKRARLKVAALGLFASRGYDATSIGAIARRAHVAVGGFYRHFSSKRQLLLALMDDLIEGIDRVDLHPRTGGGVRAGLHALLTAALGTDLRSLGAYRAWQEAVLSDAALARKQREIERWTTARIAGLLTELQRLPGARPAANIATLARVVNSLFWALIARAPHLSRVELHEWIEATTHLLYHALFTDAERLEASHHRREERTQAEG